jgi:hypothetical protein
MQKAPRTKPMMNGNLNNNSGRHLLFEDLQRYYLEHVSKYLPDPALAVAGEILDFANDGLRVGLKVDAEDCWKHRWCVAEITEMNQDRIRVHFLGWKDVWDEYIPMEEANERIAPLFSRVELPSVDISTLGLNNCTLSKDIVLAVKYLIQDFRLDSNAFGEVAGILSSVIGLGIGKQEAINHYVHMKTMSKKTTNTKTLSPEFLNALNSMRKLIDAEESAGIEDFEFELDDLINSY